MARIKSISSVSLGKVLGFMYMIISLIFSPFFFSITVSEGLGLAESAGITFFIIVLYGVMGGIGGLLTGAVYNFVAGRVGGIELEIETS